MSCDSEKLLTEKLQLTRELSTLKPEVDHLRSQLATNTALLTDKLNLQRQLSELQVQLEHAKSEAKRAHAKRRNTTFEIEQEESMADMQKALTREKRLREKAEEVLENAQAELEREKKSLQKNLAKHVKQAEEDASFEVQLEEARRHMAAEKKEKERAERTFVKSQQDWEATKALLDDKLNQFRSKLKTTKEKLRETESELAQAHQAAVAAQSNPNAAAPAKQSKKSAAPEAKQTKKRKAGEIDPDSQKLGTPGQDKPTKRGRKAAAVGDKSTFSITPFLNRTMSIAPESPASDKDDAEKAADSENGQDDDDDGNAEAEASPVTAKAKSSAKSKKNPLATVPASEENIKKPTAPRSKKQPKTIETLERVEEEEEPASQPTKEPKSKSQKPSKPAKEATTVTKIALKGGEQDDQETAPTGKQPKPKQKVRKSLATFTSFMLDPEPEEKRQKKRKLGGLGKTLFDDDDDQASKPLPGRNAIFGGARGLGPFGALKGGSILAAARGPGLAKKKGLIESDGFQFSPLKRNRGGADASILG